MSGKIMIQKCINNYVRQSVLYQNPPVSSLNDSILRKSVKFVCYKLKLKEACSTQ